MIPRIIVAALLIGVPIVAFHLLRAFVDAHAFPIAVFLVAPFI